MWYWDYNSSLGGNETQWHMRTWSEGMLQRRFSSRDLPVLAKKALLREQKFVQQHAVWNSVDLNSCFVKQGQNGHSCQCRLVRTAHAYGPYTLRGLSPLHVPGTCSLVCAGLYTLGYRNLTTNWDSQLHYVQRHYSTALVPTAVYSLAKHSRKSFTSVVAYTRFVAAFIVNRVQQVC